MEPQKDLWFRDRRRKRNKWHRLYRVEAISLVGPTNTYIDMTPCGLDVGPPIIADVVTRVPSGSAPDDEFGVCLHCLRWSEMSRRLEEKERRNG